LLQIYVFIQNESLLQYVDSTERKSIYGQHPIVMISCIHFRAKVKVLITVFPSFFANNN